MKSGVAAFVAAAVDFARHGSTANGAIILTITGDEEGVGTDGTCAILDWMDAEGERMDVCLVGEPTCPELLGDMIKIGRRGALSAQITAAGVQGHSAYPERADNPIHRLMRALNRLTAEPLDNGSDWFQPSTLQVTGFDVGNSASNVIPAAAKAFLNIRFNDLHKSSGLTARIRAVLEEEAPNHDLKVTVSGESFLTEPGPFVAGLQRAIERATGAQAKLDTGGGTSDARFITRYCPVAELGAVGATMHKVDECAPIDELRDLAKLYRMALEELVG